MFLLLLLIIYCSIVGVVLVGGVSLVRGSRRSKFLTQKKTVFFYRLYIPVKHLQQAINVSFTIWVFPVPLREKLKTRPLQVHNILCVLVFIIIFLINVYGLVFIISTIIFGNRTTMSTASRHFFHNTLQASCFTKLLTNISNK